MTARYVAIGADGETVVAVLRMSAADAVLNAPPGGSVAGISNDNGAMIQTGAVKLVGGAFVHAVTGDPVESLSGLSLTLLE